MPIPKPQPNENRGDFLNRCMANPTMTSEFPDESQRYAVCTAQLENRKAYSARTWQATDRLKAQFRRKGVKSFEKRMDRMVRPVFDAIIDRGGEQAQELIEDAIKPDQIEKEYKDFYIEVGTFFALEEYNRVKAIVPEMRTKQEGGEELKDVWAAAFADYVDKNLGKNIKSVTEDTKRLFQKYLAEILDENPGLGAASQSMQLHDKLNEKYTYDRRWRLQRIVRTETTAAASYGSVTGMESTGQNYEKEWLAAFSETREWHADAHGQIVRKDEKFIVHGEYMDRPGDPNGSAENVVNCNCTLAFQLIR